MKGSLRDGKWETTNIEWGDTRAGGGGNWWQIKKARRGSLQARARERRGRGREEKQKQAGFVGLVRFEK